jgi:hypothetical protein
MSVSVVMMPTWSTTTRGPGAEPELGAATNRVLDRLPMEPTSAILSSGSEPLVEDVTALDLDDRLVSVSGAPELVRAIVERGQVPRVQAAALGGRPAVLAATIHALRPLGRFVGVTIPGLADLAAIEGATAALRGALTTVTDVVLVVAGDLAADDPGALVRLRSALAEHDTTALADLAADLPGLAGMLAPVRLALGVARDRSERFELHADLLSGHVLYVVGSAA